MSVPTWLTPLPHALTTLAFVLHVSAGTIGLVSGTIALFARKGDRLHRGAGNVFFASMLVMATFAMYLAVAIPGQSGNLIGGTFTFYLVTTAWMTVRRREGEIGLGEKVAFGAIVVLFLPFAVASLQLATGLRLMNATGGPPHGPILIALYTVTFLVAIAVIGDARLVFAGGISGPRRIARHLWRMCVGLTFATGSAFTNGVPRLLPGPMDVTPIYFVPMLLPLGFLTYWMIRVRLTGRWREAPVAAP